MEKKPYIIGITGGTSSGKTFVIEALKDAFTGKILVISQDSYYKGSEAKLMDRWMRANLDKPSAFDSEILADHLGKLIKGQSVWAPTYDYRSHQRNDEEIELKPCPVIVVEGIMTLQNEKVRKFFDLKVFLEADADIRLGRRILRDIEERGIKTSQIRESINWYMQTVKPMYDKFIEPMKKQANLIINTNEGGIVAARKLKTLIQEKLQAK